MWLVYFNRRVFERQRRAVPFDVVVAFAAADSDIAVIVRLGVGYPIICAVQPYAADSDVCELADVCLGGAVEVVIIPVICVSFAAVNNCLYLIIVPALAPYSIVIAGAFSDPMVTFS